jgi:hypothetical protein
MKFAGVEIDEGGCWACELPGLRLRAGSRRVYRHLASPKLRRRSRVVFQFLKNRQPTEKYRIDDARRICRNEAQ